MGAVCEVETARVPPSTLLMGHRHRRWHLVVVSAGSLDEEVDGRVHTMSSGSCRISPPDTHHNMIVGSLGMTCTIVSLDKAWVDALGFPRSSLFLQSQITVDSIPETPSGAKKWSGELSRELVLRQILATLRAESEGRDPVCAPAWVEDAGAKMRHAPHLCRIESLVERSRVSRVHFSRVFRKRFGLKPVEYRTAHRLLMALRMLQFSDAPLAEIAHDSGFADQSHLTRALRQKLDVTPNQVRGAAVSAYPTIS